MDDDFGSDADFLALAAAAERSGAGPGAGPAPSAGPAPGPASAPTSAAPGTSSRVTQPTPRALPARQAASAIQVSPRQKGNPLLTHITSCPWEYADIEADYVVGATSCALYLSLRYHRLHPEYVYGRMRALGRRRYALRVLLVTVDVDNHEEPLRELAKTGLVNRLTLIVSWSAREAARYLETFRAFESAPPTAIRGAPAPQAFADRALDFAATPRGVTRPDALALLGAFGSLRTALNAPPEDLVAVQGWGEVKLRRWRAAAADPFRVGRRREGGNDGDGDGGEGGKARGEGRRTAAFVSAGAAGPAARKAMAEDGEARVRMGTAPAGEGRVEAGGDEAVDEDTLRALAEAEAEQTQPPPKRPRREEPQLDEGVAAALAKYRKE